MDDHAAVVEFDSNYDDQVVFILGSMESLLDSQDQDQPDPGQPGHDPGQTSPPRKLRKQSRILSNEEEGGDLTSTMEEKENSAAHSEPLSSPFSKDIIMQQYEESEKMFQQEILDKPVKRRQPPLIKTQPAAVRRQVSRAGTGAGMGMEHLDLLVKLMEQLSHLKEENSQLRHKCTYLSDVHSLMCVQSKMLAKDTRWKVKGQASKGSFRKKKVEEPEDTDSSDMDDLPESRKKPKLHHRSQSVGSIQIERIDLELGAKDGAKSSEKVKDASRFEAMFSKSKITSKWERVKKVFSGKPEQGSKEHTTITAEQLVRANSKHSMALSPQQLQPLPSIPTSKSYDCGMGGLRPESPDSRDHRLLRPSLSAGDAGQPPPSPSSVQSEPLVHSLSTEIPSVTTDGIYEEVLPISPPQDCISSMAGEGEVRVTASKDYSSSDEPRSPQFLSVQDSLMMKRRQSSPALSLCDESEFQNMSLDGKDSKLGRSHSFKASKSDVETTGSESYLQRKKCKSSRTAWGRVKDIIHTRKDSLKRKNKRSNSAGDTLPDGTASDGEFFCFRYDYEDMEHWEQGSPVRKGSLPGDSPKTPIYPDREPDYKSASGSPPSSKQELYQGALSAPSSPPQHFDVTALMSSVSDDFNKKIQEWEDKKRKSIYRENSCLDDEDSQRARAAKFTDDFIRKMEEWERIKGLSSKKSRGSGKLCQSPVGANSPEEQQPPPSLEQLQKHLSESFSKTVKEWQRIKESRIKDSGSPVPETGPRGIQRSRKQDRSKSRERDRSRSKYERQREKELQKIEKKEQKIEKEKEKLEMMKRKLEDLETMSEAEVRGLTKEFARKLHEWEQMKGMRQKEASEEGVTTPPSDLREPRYGVHVRSNSAKEHRNDQGKADSLKRDRAQSEYGRRERTHSDSKTGKKDSLEGSTESKLTERSQRSSSVPLLGQSNLVDDSTSIDLSLTSETVNALEETNRQLRDEVQEKDEDLLLLQDEIQQLTERINMMNKEQSRQIELYKRELWASSRLGRHTIENDLVSASIRELGDTVDQINRQQNQVLLEKDTLKVQLEEEITGRHAAEVQVIERLQHVQRNLTAANPEGLERFCVFFKKLQEQLAELKLGVAERNQLVYKLHHQLVTQEVQNRLLQTDLQRTHMQVDFLQDAKSRGTLRRVKTFAGADFVTRGEGAVKCRHRRSGRLSMYKKPILLSRDLLQDLHHALHLSLETDWDWLHRLHGYSHMLQGTMCVESEGCQTDRFGADVSVQTVMTLCKVPYNVPQSPRPAPHEAKATQTDSQVIPSHTSPVSSTINVSITPSRVPPPIPVRSSIVMGGKAQQYQQHKSEQPDSLTHAPKPAPKSPPHVIHVLQSSQVLQNSPSLSPGRAPPKPPRRRLLSRQDPVNMSTVTASMSTTTDTVASVASPPRTTKIRDSRTIENDDMKLTFSVENIQTAVNDSERQTKHESKHESKHERHETKASNFSVPSQGSSDTDEVFSDSQAHPPYSPIIRSRYPRKLRSEPKCVNAENRLWKATPPRRVIRHRKSSTERKHGDDVQSQDHPDVTARSQDHPDVMVRSQDHPDVMTRSQEHPVEVPTPPLSSRSLPCDLRQLQSPAGPLQPRVQSDCYTPSRDLLPIPTEHYMNNDYLRGRYRFRYQREMQRLPVQDMISRFESAYRAPNPNPPNPISPPLDLDGRKSPIQRPIQSPVHKLKTAQELLVEHEAKWNSLGRRGRSSSSNRTEEGRVKISSTSSDKENENRASQSEAIKEVVQRLASPPREVTKPPLKDLTNGAKVKHIKDSLEQPSGSPKMHGSEVSQRSRSTSPRSHPHVTFAKCEDESPWDLQPAASPSSSRITTPPSSPSSGGKPRLKKTQSSPSSSPAPSSPKGAISMLCRQALVVNLEQVEVPEYEDLGSDPTHDDRKKGMGKLLDTHWLQKPKKFFKVSKS